MHTISEFRFDEDSDELAFQFHSCGWKRLPVQLRKLVDTSDGDMNETNRYETTWEKVVSLAGDRMISDTGVSDVELDEIRRL